VSAGDGTLKVRAVCPAGHETLTTAPKGRVTWRGPCHTEGCEHRIVARKVLEAPGEPAKTAEPSDPPKPAKKIRKVAAYRGTQGQQQSSQPGFDAAGAGGEPSSSAGPDGGRAGVPDPAAGGGSAGGAPAVPASRPGVRERVAAARQRRAERRLADLDDDKPWTIPGIYR
jgi:hypothetical protein